MPPRTPPNATASLSPPLPLTASPIRESVPLTDDPGPPVERRGDGIVMWWPERRGEGKEIWLAERRGEGIFSGPTGGAREL